MKKRFSSLMVCLGGLLVTLPAAFAQDPRPTSGPDRARAAADRTDRKAADQGAQVDRQLGDMEKAAKDKTDAAGHGAVPQRAIVHKMLADVKKHEVRVARMDRLHEVFSARGDTAKVQQLADMKAAEMQRHEQKMQGYRAELGDDRFHTVQNAFGDMRTKRGRKGIDRRGDRRGDPRVDRADPKVDGMGDRRTDRKLDPKVDRVDPKVDGPKVDGKGDRRVDPKVDGQGDRRGDRKIDGQGDRKIDPRVDRKVDGVDPVDRPAPRRDGNRPGNRQGTPRKDGR